MTISVGIGLAFIAMLCWGFGDFLIQKSTRKVGDWETLFIISLLQFAMLLPFAWKEIPSLLTAGILTYQVLISASFVLFVAALIEFESLREGKLSVIEPAWSMEIPAAAFLAFLILHENIGWLQVVLIVLLMLSLILVAFRGRRITKRLFLEKGILIGLLGGVIMGGANFLMGWGGRVTSPVMINWFTDVFMILATGGYLVYNGRLSRAFKDLKLHYKLLVPMSIIDGIAWIAFTASMVLAPIAISTALSESYIIVAVLLGLFISKEKIHLHQKIGLVGAVITAVILAIITS